MIANLFKAIFGSANDRRVKQLRAEADRINKIYPTLSSLSDEQLKAKTQEFRARFQKGESLESMLPEAFAVVKDCCRRLCGQSFDILGKVETWNMIPFDVQLIGGMVIHRGGIAEMQTGEGKTLTAAMPLYLNAMTGRNCQLVTTNDYLARRDSEWIGQIFRWMGLTVGCAQHGQNPDERRAQYACDITYGTNSEFGFDYLRDQGMATRPEEIVQRDHYFVIVDEIDSILIDEARTPLIISGAVASSSQDYDRLKPGIERLVRKQEALIEEMLDKAEKVLKSEKPGSDAFKDAAFELCKVRLGSPKNKRLMALLEEANIRREYEKQDLSFYSDSNRGLLQKTKQELFFAIDEKHHDTDLSDKGRAVIAPDDPDAYLLPDIVEQFQTIDADRSLDEDGRLAARRAAQEKYANKTSEIHTIAQLLKAYCLYEKDIAYIVDYSSGEGKVVIVDENTGRALPGRRYSEGLHQALEAKENVRIEAETQTLATITIQNYFRLYTKLGGMTGTALTEAAEFKEIYKLETVAIPPNRVCLRTDLNDRIFKTAREKYNAITAEVQAVHELGRPILLGTPTVEVSEIISKYLQNAGVPHKVLNARRHQAEAEIISLAGQRSAVTIATNMAGRGTDIKLGPGVAELGGLHVIGAERHDSRRIDRQLRGRCARQGDPGSSLFFISLEDKLMRLFGSDRIAGVLERMGLKEGEQLESGMLTYTIENAQKKVENQNFYSRKKTLEYDDVMNKQRTIIYKLRRDILHAQNPRKRLFDILVNTLEEKCERAAAKNQSKGPRPIDRKPLEKWLAATFPLDLDLETLAFDGSLSPNQLAAKLAERIEAAYVKKESEDEVEYLRRHERNIMLAAIDKLWIEHLRGMDHLRQNVQFSSIAQKDPLVEYKQQAFQMFDEFEIAVADDILKNMFAEDQSLERLLRKLHSTPLDEHSAADSEEQQFLMALQQLMSMGFRPQTATRDDLKAAKDLEADGEQRV
ncbi:MAG: preprotein translocase subunit SecA [Verrucomicrobiota bacterium]|jgi:preprotein translocase subunit SecA